MPPFGLRELVVDDDLGFAADEVAFTPALVRTCGWAVVLAIDEPLRFPCWPGRFVSARGDVGEIFMFEGRWASNWAVSCG